MLRFVGFRRSGELSWLGQDRLTDEFSDFWVGEELGEDNHVPIVKLVGDARDAFLAF